MKFSYTTKTSGGLNDESGWRMTEQSDFLYKMEQVIFLEACAVRNSVSL